MAQDKHLAAAIVISAYPDAPCGAMRTNSVEGDMWPRCDDQGYFEPLQCDPSARQCWCVDKWGNIEPGSRRISQKPQCGHNYSLKGNNVNLYEQNFIIMS